jgi:hypothetical protein
LDRNGIVRINYNAARLAAIWHILGITLGAGIRETGNALYCKSFSRGAGGRLGVFQLDDEGMHHAGFFV